MLLVFVHLVVRDSLAGQELAAGIGERPNPATAGATWIYRMTARNFGPLIAVAARTTIATVHEAVPLNALDPEWVVTPCIFV